ncbi:MAG: hypothetical protein ACRD1B_08870, partial [Thermoanaerobaculia bacterium]
MRATLCSEDGKDLRSVVRKVERGHVAGIPVVSGASKIRLEAEGFEPITVPISTARVSVVPLSPLATLTVEGLISGSTESPPQPVRVWARRKGSAEVVQSNARADRKGRFSVSLPAGEWDLAFQPGGLAPITASESVTVGESRALAAPSAGPGLRVRLGVRDEKGQPVPNARASWSLAGSPTPEDLRRQGKSRLPYIPPLLEGAVNSIEPQTDAAGTILREAIPDLPQAWTVRAGGFRKQRVRLRRDPEKQEPVLVITMRPLPNLAVSVRDLTGQNANLTLEVAQRPIESLISAPYQPFWKGAIPTGAHRRFPLIAEAEYRLDLRDPNGVLQVREELSPSDPDWELPEILRTLVRESRTIAGRVMRGEAPLEGVLFFPRLQSPWPQREDMVYPLDRLAEFAPRSDGDGRFAVVVGGPGRYLLDYSSADSRVRGTTEVVDLIVQREAWLDVTVPAGHMDVRVIEAGGDSPVPDASLRIDLTLSNGDRRQMLARSDANGRYSLVGFDSSATVSI